MGESGLAGIGRFVMRNRQYLGCLRVRDRVLTLEQMHFADEVDPPQGIVPSRFPSVSARELELAKGLIESLAGDWKPSRYKDTYTDALLSVIKRKQKGEEIHAAPAAEEEEQPDLMEALRASMEATKKRRGARSRATSRRGTSSAKTSGSSRKPRRASSSRSRR